MGQVLAGAWSCCYPDGKGGAGWVCSTFLPKLCSGAGGQDLALKAAAPLAGGHGVRGGHNQEGRAADRQRWKLLPWHRVVPV